MMRRTLFILFCLCLFAGTIFAQETASTQAENDLSELSDDFEDADTLSNWLTLTDSEGWWDMVKTVDINTTSEGHLYFEPDTSGWYAEYHGAFLYKEVTGDFIVTTKLWAKGKDADIATQEWSLTGLMARVQRDDTPETWEAGQENWVFITTGVADVVTQPVFETKTTVDSVSTLRLHPTKEGWVELAMARIGANFVVFARYEGEDWKIKARFTREDMPETLQVGLNAYTDWFPRDTEDPALFNNVPTENGEPDLIVLVDYIHFERPNLPAEFDVSKVRSMKESAVIAALFGE